MSRAYILFSVDENKYWTGRVWDCAYSRNIEEAQQFNSLEDIDEMLNIRRDEDESLYDEVEEMGMMEAKTIYVA
jgi:hypothetical protein